MYLFFKTSQSKFVHLLGSTWGEEVQECKQMDVISLNEWTNKEEKRLQEEEWRLQVARKIKWKKMDLSASAGVPAGTKYQGVRAAHAMCTHTSSSPLSSLTSWTSTDQRFSVVMALLDKS
jgi:hypothetical protein